MLTYQEAYHQLTKRLQPLYDAQEAAAIAHELLLHITGQDKLQRLMNRDQTLTFSQEQQYAEAAEQLANGKPLQYVTAQAWFMGRPYKVNEHVLIPRPETEELVQWIADEWKDKPCNILDIGTGSGCIPIALKLLLPSATIASCDVSANAIQVAKENAAALQADITVQQLDFLNVEDWTQLGQYDVIVSNPPYIPESEINNIHPNVKDHEPHLALFVPNDDPLMFYKAIAAFGKTHLKQDSAVYCELHMDHALQTGAMFEEMGYKVEVRKDMHGNWRMLKALIG